MTLAKENVTQDVALESDSLSAITRLKERSHGASVYDLMCEHIHLLSVGCKQAELLMSSSVFGSIKAHSNSFSK